MKTWILNNLTLKIVALVLAIISYSYISGEVRNARGPQDRDLMEFAFGQKLSSKEIKIYPSIVGEPYRGYKVDYARIKITPANYILVGPADIIEKIENIKTLPISVDEQKKGFTISTTLKPIHDRIPLPDQVVKVYVPINSE